MQLLNPTGNAWHFLAEGFYLIVLFWLAVVQILKLRQNIGWSVLLFLKTKLCLKRLENVVGVVGEA